MNIWANIWIQSNRRKYSRFFRDSTSVGKTQFSYLKKRLEESAYTAFGRDHSFDKIRSYSDYVNYLPIRSWDGFSPWIQKMEQGISDQLFPGNPLFFEYTSGTTGPRKKIPFNNSLKNEFTSAIGIWAYALSKHHPKAFSGKSYWAISPQFDQANGEPKVNDTDYFNSVTAWFMKKILVAPNLSDVSLATEFYKKTILAMLETQDLSFISAWSPTYLLQLNEYLTGHLDYFREQVSQSILLKPREKQSIIEALSPPFDWARIWPDLSVVSCWTHGSAQFWIPKLRNLIGSAFVEGKGLISTEAIISIGIIPSHDPALTISTHFYEFMCIDTNGVYLADELKLDHVYHVIVTTGGGFYRYTTGDLIKVTGFINEIPCFQFIGRGQDVSDTVGEKLSVPMLVDMMNSFFIATGIPTCQMAFYPTETATGVYYSVFLNTDVSVGNPDGYAPILDTILSQNPHYSLARKLGQLHPIKLYSASDQFFFDLYHFIKQKRHISDGDFKPPILFQAKELDTFSPFARIVSHEI